MKIDVSLTEKSIQDAIDKLERYKDRLQDKCIAFVGELASNGIAVARANTGNFGHYITFSYEIKDTTDGCTAIVLDTETGQIQSTWQTADPPSPPPPGPKFSPQPDSDKSRCRRNQWS